MNVCASNGYERTKLWQKVTQCFNIRLNLGRNLVSKWQHTLLVLFFALPRTFNWYKRLTFPVLASTHGAGSIFSFVCLCHWFRNIFVVQEADKVRVWRYLHNVYALEYNTLLFMNGLFLALQEKIETSVLQTNTKHQTLQWPSSMLSSMCHDTFKCWLNLSIFLAIAQETANFS